MNKTNSLPNDTSNNNNMNTITYKHLRDLLKSTATNYSTSN